MIAARRWLGRALRVGVSLGILGYILFDVDNQDLWTALTSVRPSFVLAAVGLYAVGQASSAFKWSMLGRSVGFDRPVTAYVRFYFIGMFVNIFGLSTIGGDVVRALYLSDGRRPGLALHSVVFDRVSGLAILMAIGAAALLVYPQPGLPWLLTFAATAGGIALVVGWWLCPRLVRFLPARNWLRRQVETDLAAFWRDPGLLGRVAIVSLGFHLLQVCVQWILVRAAGAEVPFSYCLVFHPMLCVMMALPVSLGGFGVREGGYLYFLTAIDVDDSIAVTTGLLWWAVNVLAGLIGGVCFVATGARLPRLRGPAGRPEARAA